MDCVRKYLKNLSVRKCMICFLIYSLILNTSLPSVLALEAGDVINSTGVINSSWGNNTVINTNHGAIINWNNFNTSSSQSVTFNQYKNGSLSSNSAVLNRISSGGVPTQFDGVLNANGRVFIINPAGIIFGKGSSINANQLIASSLDMTNTDFLNENYEFITGTDNIGAVVNNGNITTAEGIAMIGRKVLNAGTIITGREGFVVMTAGDKVLLKEPSSSIIVQMDSVTLPSNLYANGVGSVINESTGEIISPAGTIVLAAGDIFTIAMELDSKAARIVNGIGTVLQNGIINADGINSNGGNINLLAGQEIVLAEGSLTTVNAGLNGIGGQMILFSNGTTFVNEGAMIMAMGGTVSGAGGFVEISGNHFGISGDINASAINGAPGTILIDPLNIIIANGSNQGQLDTLYEENIEYYSQAGTNILIEAENSITVQNIFDDEITGGSGSITLRTTEADSLISFLDKSDTISTTMDNAVFKFGYDGGNVNKSVTTQSIPGGKNATNQTNVTTENAACKAYSKSYKTTENSNGSNIKINCNDDCGTKPDCSKPDNSKPDCSKPDCSKPDCPKPNCPKPDCPKPDCPEPDYPEPDCPEPDYPEPDCPEPDYPEPDYPEPDYPEPDCPEPEPEPLPPVGPDEQKSQVFSAVAPLPDEPEIEYSDCTALINWTADELGIDDKTMQISIASNLTSIRNMEPCEMCARLKQAAAVLQDAEGIYTAALAQVINEYASDAAPPSGEQMASIANAIASNIDVSTHYAASGEYLDALAEYVGILNNEMNYSAEESIMFAADNYISRLGGIENRNIADFLAARLATLGG